MPARILCAIGTRPEVIKMAPVVEALRARGLCAEIVATGQHGALVARHLTDLELAADHILPTPATGLDLAEMTAALLPPFHHILRAVEPDAVLAQGDTATAFVASLAAFYAGVPFGLVEAGLRSGVLRAPFPEEGLRRLASVLARWQFAPTPRAQQALLAEGHSGDSIHVVGNTAIDSLMRAVQLPSRWPRAVGHLDPGERLAVMTAHRRENLGAPLQRIRDAVVALATRHPRLRLTVVTHPNGGLQGAGACWSGGLRNIEVLDPIDHRELVTLLQSASLVLTDSGGIQEEACHLGIPLLVLRDVTERPEVAEAGGAVLVGTDPQRILAEAERLLTDPAHHAAMARPRALFGDGRAGDRIAALLACDLTPAHRRGNPRRNGDAEAIAAWLLSDRVQLCDGPHAGAIAGWIDDQGRPAFLYPEVTGYYLTALAFLSRTMPRLGQESARRARAAVAWLDRLCGGRFPTRLGDEAASDFRNQASFAFDLAMCVRGLDAARSVLDVQVDAPRASLLQRLLPHCSADGIAAAIAHDGTPLPVRWSTSPGPYQLKISLALLGNAPVPPRIETAARAVCARFASGSQGEDELHPALYAIEGLLGLGVHGRPALIERASAGFASVMRRLDGGPPGDPCLPLERIRADVLAQALRLGAALPLAGGAVLDRDRLALGGIRTALALRKGAGGGVSFEVRERTPRHWNVWAAIFAMQGMWLHDRMEAADPVDRELLELLA